MNFTRLFSHHFLRGKTMRTLFDLSFPVKRKKSSVKAISALFCPTFLADSSSFYRRNISPTRLLATASIPSTSSFVTSTSHSLIHPTLLSSPFTSSLSSSTACHSAASATLRGADLSSRTTWDDFYSRRPAEEKSFDWFLDADLVVERISRSVDQFLDHLKLNQQQQPQQPLTLVDAGCGTSSVFPKLLFHPSPIALHLICVDFCGEALNSVEDEVARLRSGVTSNSVSGFVVATREDPSSSSSFSSINASSQSSAIEFVNADLKQLPFADASVDFILDKGATDAVLRSGGGEGKGGGGGNVDNFRRCWAEFVRALRVDRIGGILHVSDEDPDVRLQFLDDILRRVCELTPEVNEMVADDPPTSTPQLSRDDIDISVQTIEVNGREIFFYFVTLLPKLSSA